MTPDSTFDRQPSHNALVGREREVVELRAGLDDGECWSWPTVSAQRRAGHWQDSSRRGDLPRGVGARDARSVGPMLAARDAP
jgi:hypothetical protein